MLFSVAAFAECDTGDCDPYTSYCTQTCSVCTHYNQDGCDRWRSSTCGDEMVACLQSGCTPSWRETSRTIVGTYDGNSLSNCTWHNVDSVTKHDDNQCNINSAYYDETYCEDTIVDWKNTCCWPSCCSGTGDMGNSLWCNGYHSCS